MKPRAPIIIPSLGLLIATVAMVGRQHQHLGVLRAELQQFQLHAEALTNGSPATKQEATPAVTTPHSGPSLELLRLRSQVGQLERRKRELANVPEENKQLQAQLVAKAKNGTSGGDLPAGYIRKSEARFAGFGTPEDSVQSFLWAIEHRDVPTLTQFLAPEQAKQMAAELERRGATEAFFKDAGLMPGLLVTGRETKEDGTVELKVQLDPNDDSTRQTMKFRQFNGQWKLNSGF